MVTADARRNIQKEWKKLCIQDNSTTIQRHRKKKLRKKKTGKTVSSERMKMEQAFITAQFKIAHFDFIYIFQNKLTKSLQKILKKYIKKLWKLEIYKIHLALILSLRMIHQLDKLLFKCSYLIK